MLGQICQAVAGNLLNFSIYISLFMEHHFWKSVLIRLAVYVQMDGVQMYQTALFLYLSTSTRNIFVTACIKVYLRLNFYK